MTPAVDRWCRRAAAARLLERDAPPQCPSLIRKAQHPAQPLPMMIAALRDKRSYMRFGKHGSLLSSWHRAGARRCCCTPHAEASEPRARGQCRSGRQHAAGPQHMPPLSDTRASLLLEQAIEQTNTGQRNTLCSSFKASKQSLKALSRGRGTERDLVKPQNKTAQTERLEIVCWVGTSLGWDVVSGGIGLPS